jgi:DNA polymerase elongation subunit (family B)
LKILLNAVYGGFAINSFRFTDGFKILSSSITTTGQRFIMETIKYANKTIKEDYFS